jgi:hypothetical protein
MKWLIVRHNIHGIQHDGNYDNHYTYHSLLFFDFVGWCCSEDHTDHYSYMLSKTGGVAAAAGATRSLFDTDGRYLSTTALRTGLGATHSFDTQADTYVPSPNYFQTFRSSSIIICCGLCLFVGRTAHLHSTYRTDFCREGPSVATVRDVPPLTPIYRKVPAYVSSPPSFSFVTRSIVVTLVGM